MAATETAEVISPELALVDPELRARALAGLADPPWAPRPALRLVSSPVPVEHTRAVSLAIPAAIYVVVSAVHFAVWGLLAVAVIILSIVLAILV